MSRGAASVTIVDSSRKSVEIIKRNVEKTAASAKTAFRPKIVQKPVVDFLRDTGGKYDFVFADAPYDWDGSPTLPDLVANSGILKPGGLFVMECASRNVPKVLRAADRVNKYGDTSLLFYGQSGVES